MQPPAYLVAGILLKGLLSGDCSIPPSRSDALEYAASRVVDCFWGRKAVMDPVSVSGLRLVVQMSFDLRVRDSHFYLGFPFGKMESAARVLLQGSVEILR